MVSNKFHKFASFTIFATYDLDWICLVRWNLRIANIVKIFTASFDFARFFFYEDFKWKQSVLATIFPVVDDDFADDFCLIEIKLDPRPFIL